VADPIGGESNAWQDISVHAARIDNAIVLVNLTSEVALEEHEIGSTDLNIPIDNKCTKEELLIGMPRG